MTTLSKLLEHHDSTHYVYADDGNGCAFGRRGVALTAWEDDMQAYGRIHLYPLDRPHTSEDGHHCTFASEWITAGHGDNAYRFRLYF